MSSTTALDSSPSLGMTCPSQVTSSRSACAYWPSWPPQFRLADSVFPRIKGVWPYALSQTIATLLARGRKTLFS